ncbi:hypothetical protein J5N97_003039 [Dioscorea zingiberensis]|uniref:Uncharacterized protein n=1 Tax=Dioscorea zingiberensis TaxID=325984 RepID=A0A9D5D5Y1_9LILI|nr:hypothetical protein J5N97_003039 [Dioscorea zingiberensis]
MRWGSEGTRWTDAASSWPPVRKERWTGSDAPPVAATGTFTGKTPTRPRRSLPTTARLPGTSITTTTTISLTGHRGRWRCRPRHRRRGTNAMATGNFGPGGGGGVGASSSGGKKRFRTKFTQEQKDKMLALAEKLGWRIQKHDEAAVQEFCNETSVKRHVLKLFSCSGGGGCTV